jgi:5-methylcytosine-specific restriction endonuclease McrA
VTRWKPCLAPGCPELVESGRCPEHTPERRPTPRPPRHQTNQAHYDAEWNRISVRYRRHHPVCECSDLGCRCGGEGCTQPSAETDHIIARRHFATAAAANREENLQALCGGCHKSKTARLDR